MRPLPPLLLAAALATAEPAPAEPAVVLQEVSYGQRIDFVLGDGTQPFADEDQRRVQLVLGVRLPGPAALLGWRALEARATSDQGEDLPLAIPVSEGVFASDHLLAPDQTASLPGLAVPVTRQTLSRLAVLAGSVELRLSRVAAEGAVVPLANLRADRAVPVPGLERGGMTLAERADNRLAVHFDAAASLALADVVPRAADGQAVPLRNRRLEWRDGQARFTANLKSAQIATVEVLTYRRIEVQRVAFTCREVDLGLALPGREALRGATRRGAGEF